MRSFLSVLVVMLMAAMPGLALAQAPRPPAIEVGAQVSKKVGGPDAVPVTWSPRVTLNLTHLTAIEGTADIQKAFVERYEGAPRISSRGYSAHWRQTLL